MPPRAPRPLPPGVDGIALRAIAEELAAVALLPAPRSVALDAPPWGARGPANDPAPLTRAEVSIDRGDVARARRALHHVEALPAEHQPTARWVARAPLHPGVHTWPAELARTLGPRDLVEREARAVVALDVARKAKRDAAMRARIGAIPAWQGGYAGDAAARLVGAEVHHTAALESLEAWGASRLAGFVEAWRAVARGRDAA